MVYSYSSRYTKDGRVCPMRKMRAIACALCTAGGPQAVARCRVGRTDFNNAFTVRGTSIGQMPAGCIGFNDALR